MTVSVKPSLSVAEAHLITTTVQNTISETIGSKARAHVGFRAEKDLSDQGGLEAGAHA